ncbi:MAG: YdeI/OmpD-associated family protein [Verrucomicrobiota bacterium]
MDAYIKRAAPFARPILKHLRALVHASCPQVEETIKWQCPSFEHKGLMCGMAAFNNHCAFGFWKTELLFDGDRRADREAMGQFGQITSLADLPSDRTLVSYVRKASKLNEAGIRTARSKPRKRPPPKVPSYFRTALGKSAKAKNTFENLSPSHKRDYIEWLTEAKRTETRGYRLKMSILWLSQGKPRNWKYMPEWR